MWVYLCVWSEMTCKPWSQINPHQQSQKILLHLSIKAPSCQSYRQGSVDNEHTHEYNRCRKVKLRDERRENRASADKRKTQLCLYSPAFCQTRANDWMSLNSIKISFSLSAWRLNKDPEDWHFYTKSNSSSILTITQLTTFSSTSLSWFKALKNVF